MMEGSKEGKYEASAFSHVHKELMTSYTQKSVLWSTTLTEVNRVNDFRFLTTKMSVPSRPLFWRANIEWPTRDGAGGPEMDKWVYCSESRNLQWFSALLLNLRCGL